ncbi:MAG: copper ion binding protein [Acidibacillus sp.]|uniref:Copper chaperone CopZ n=1 Tax=Sulfoacidibacillus ferrooxidans TaxID=2005001 RepID=A0A9X2ACA5_9BACL|nr:copper ion binding protein [Sulfoacidibacillus ferrooxidans]MCI0183923.1 Copper chaperone CopZ [Sulfoacidibacillus ferrooxidans]MCY0893593.1 copper ion binding protein [Acidibacillus sp.]
MKVETLKVKGMTCNHCKHAVETALVDIDGISKATVELDKGQVVVEFKKDVSKDVLRAAIDDAGYELIE